MPSTLFEARAENMNGGLNLNTERGLKFEEISYGEALRFERGAGIMTGPGYLLSGLVEEGGAGRGSLEANRIRPTAWVKAGTKIKYSHDAVTWYDTGATVTDLIRQAFVEIDDGDILSSNQIDDNLRFAVAPLQDAITAASTEVEVGAAYIDKFDAAGGTVTIRGDTIAYTGTNTGTGKLTGVTGIDAGGHPAGELVVEWTEPSSFQTYKGNILFKFQSRVLMAGILGFEHVVAYSAIADLANPQFYWDFDGNGAYQKEMPMRITAAIAGEKTGYILGDPGVHQILDFDLQSGALLTQELSPIEGAYNPDCVVNMGGIVAFMGRNRLFPITLTLDPAAQASPYLGNEFDRPLRPWLQSHDSIDEQADVAFLKLDTSQNLLKMGASVDGALETYVHDNDVESHGFLPKENRPIGTSFMLNGRSYFVHRDNGKCFEDDIGRTNDGAPIAHIITTGEIEADNGRRYMKGQYVTYEGWMTQGTLHTLKVYIGGSSEPSFEQEYSWEDLITLQSGRPIGLRGVGLTTAGGSGGGSVTVYKFENQVIIRGLNEDSFRIEWEVTEEGNFMQLNTWYLSAHPTRKQPRTKQ